jgi:hypothetical protein
VPNAGWYDDPDGSQDMLRYWDGTGWTVHRRRAEEIAYPPPVGPIRIGSDVQPSARARFADAGTDPRPQSDVGQREVFPVNDPASSWRKAYTGSPHPEHMSVGNAGGQRWDPVQQRYVGGPYSPAPPYGHTSSSSVQPSNGFSTAGIAMGIISLLILPIIFGVLGIIFSCIALGRKEPRAGAALAVSVIGLIGGMIIGAVVWTQVVEV